MFGDAGRERKTQIDLRGQACVTKLHVLVEDWLEDTYI